MGFNPTNTTPPFIQAFDPSFLQPNVTGPNATIQLVASHPGYAIAHEAPIYDPDLNVVFFCSNPGGTLGYSGWYNNSVVSMLNMTQVESALNASSSGINAQIQTVSRIYNKHQARTTDNCLVEPFQHGTNDQWGHRPIQGKPSLRHVRARPSTSIGCPREPLSTVQYDGSAGQLFRQAVQLTQRCQDTPGYRYRLLHRSPVSFLPNWEPKIPTGGMQIWLVAWIPSRTDVAFTGLSIRSIDWSSPSCRGPIRSPEWDRFHPGW